MIVEKLRTFFSNKQTDHHFHLQLMAGLLVKYANLKTLLASNSELSINIRDPVSEGV